jgi:type II secretory pathway predicted ATPase ExeA
MTFTPIHLSAALRVEAPISRPRDPVSVHWNLRGHPFPTDPGLDMAFSTGTDRDPTRRLLARLDGNLGPVLVLGPEGVGKTYLARWVAALLRRRDVVLRLSARALDGDGLLATVSRALNLDPDRPAGKTARVLAARLLALGLGGRRVILLLDDAETLTAPDLLDLLRLDRLETGRGRLLRLVLLGRPEAKARVARLSPLAKRLGPGMLLAPLTRENAEAYLTLRLDLVAPPDENGGAAPAPMAPAARRLLVRESQGLPGTLDCLAARALDLAAAEGAARVETTHVKRALRVLGLARAPSLSVLFPRLAAHRAGAAAAPMAVAQAAR